MNPSLLASVVLLAASAGAGCTIIDKDIGVGLSAAAEPLLQTEDVVHVDAVLAGLGPPHQLVALEQGYAFLYQKFDVRERQLGLSVDAPVLRLLKFSLADARSQSEAFLLRFDSTDNVVAASLASNNEELGEAGSILFALNFLSQVDSAALDSDIWGPSKWGKYLLQEPGVLLNAQNSPDRGDRVLDQRGTPINVGQRTMDHRR